MTASSASSTNYISRSGPDPELPRHLPGSTKGILDLTATRRQWVLEMDKDKQMVKLKESSHLPIPSCNHDKPCRRFLLAETRKRRTWKRKQRGQLVLHENAMVESDVKTEKGGEGKGDILKIIMAHISVKCIPLQALETPVCEVLAGIIVLAGTLTVFQLANLRY